MANDYVITVRTVLDTNAAASAGASTGSPGPFAALEREAQRSLKTIEKTFAGSGPAIYKSLDAGREAWVTEQIRAAERASKGMIGSMISAANSTIEQQNRAARETEKIGERAARTEARARERQMRDAQRDIARMARDRERIMESNDRAIERGEEASYRRRIAAAQRAAREQANAFISATRGGGPGGGGGFGGSGGGGFGGFGGIFSGGSLGSIAGGLVGGAAVLAGQELISDIKQGASAWLDYASKLQNAKIAFTSMLGSAQLAEEHLNELKKFALETPFQFADLVDASQRMQALGFRAKEVVPILRDVGNAVAAAGGGADRLDRVIKALSDVRAKEKLQTQEIRQFAEAGISVYKILQEETGKSVAEIQKLTEAGQIGSDMFLRAFQKYSQAHFGDMMEKQSRTFAGALSNIQDVLLQTAGKAFEPLFAKISQIAYRVQQELQKAKDLGEVSDILGDAFGELGGFLAEKLTEGIIRQYTKAATWKRILLGAWPMIFQAVSSIFEEILPKETKLMLGWDVPTESVSNLGRVSEEAVRKVIPLVEATDRLKTNFDQLLSPTLKETAAVNDQADAYTNLEKRIKLFQNAAAKPPETHFEVLPDKLKEQAYALANTIRENARTIQAAADPTSYSALHGGITDENFGKAVFASRQELSALVKQVRETTAAFAGPGGANKAYADFIAGLGDDDLSRAIKLVGTFDARIKAVDEAARKAEEARRQRMADLKQVADTLDQKLAELTEQHRQLNAEVGKAPDALKDYDTWLSRQDAKFKQLTESTPALAQKLADLRKEVEAFSKDQAAAALSDMVAEVNKELDRYKDRGREADTASERLQAKFDASGLGARAAAEDVKKFTDALADLALKEKDAKFDKMVDAIYKIRAKLQEDTRELQRGHEGPRDFLADTLDRIAELDNIRLPVNAFQPVIDLMKALKATGSDARTNSDALERMLQAIFMTSSAVKGITSETERWTIVNRLVKETMGAITDAAARQAEQLTPLQRAQKELNDIEAGDTKALAKLHESTDLNRVSSRISLKQEIVDLEDAIAHAGEDSADRERVAYLSAIRDIQEADERARESMIHSQVEIADQTIFHADRARAAILEHMASMRGVTDIFADAYMKVIDTAGDALDRLFGNLTKKLGAFGDILRSILSDLARLALNALFRSLLNAILGPGSGGTVGVNAGGGGGGGGSGGGGWLGSIISGIFGGRRTSSGSAGGGSTAGGGFFGGGSNPFAAAAAGMLPGAGGLPSWTAGSEQAGVLQSIGHEGIHAAGAAAGPAGGILSALGGMAPLLGLSLGAGLGSGLGGQSSLGRILGGVGGGLLGGALGIGVGLATGALSLSTFAPIIAVLGPLAAIAGPALIIGAILLSRNARRRNEERQRNQWSIDTLAAVQQILAQAQSGQLGLSDATAAWNQIHNQYMQNVATLKDRKTKDHASKWWDQDIAPYYWPLIEKAAKDNDRAKEFETKFVPTFAVGGKVRNRLMSGAAFNRSGETLAWVGPEEAVLTPEHVARLGGTRAMAAAGVPGFTDASTNSANGSGSSGIVGASAGWNPTVIVVFSEEEARELAGNIPHSVIANKIEQNLGAPGSTLRSRLARSLSNP